MQGSFYVVASNFEEVTLCGDVVYFEFCLHEIDDPRKSFSHARTRHRCIRPFAELVAKVTVQGAIAIQRAGRVAGGHKYCHPRELRTRPVVAGRE
jgi:hypothetical protein